MSIGAYGILMMAGMGVMLFVAFDSLRSEPLLTKRAAIFCGVVGFVAFVVGAAKFWNSQ